MISTCHNEFRNSEEPKGSPRAPFLFAKTFRRVSRAYTGPAAVRALPLPLFETRDHCLTDDGPLPPDSDP